MPKPENATSVKNFSCCLRKFQIGLALFGVNDKTEARAKGETFRHKERLSSARSLNEAPKALTSKAEAYGVNSIGGTRACFPDKTGLKSAEGRPAESVTRERRRREAHGAVFQKILKN